MTVKEMWKGTLAIKAVTIVLALMFFSFGVDLLYSIVGVIILAGGCWMALRGGAAAGHAACGISAEIEDIRKTPERAGQIDAALLKQAYSPSHATAALFAGALIDYVINVIYIIMMLLRVSDDVLIFGRLASFAVSLPLWSIVSIWHTMFNTLSADIVIMLLAGPFLIPLFQVIGYLQGPKLWKKSEEAMAAGRRRAKARSRINQKPRQVKVRKPEV